MHAPLRHPKNLLHRRGQMTLTQYGNYRKYGSSRLERRILSIPYRAKSNIMLRRKLIAIQEKGTLGYLVHTPKALRILLTHKFRDQRFQRLLTGSICLLLAILGCGFCGFSLFPTVWAVSAFTPLLFLVVLVLSIGAGDLFLQFALEDDRFFEVATKSHALSVFEDDDQSLLRPPL